jgi:hypothetical protein
MKKKYFYLKINIIFYEAGDFVQCLNVFDISEYCGKLLRISRISRSFDEITVCRAWDISGRWFPRPPHPAISQSLWSPYLIFHKTVAYLPHAGKVEPQNQPFLSNTRTNNGTAGLRNPFLGYGPVNQLQRRRMTSHSNSTGWESRDLSTARYSWLNSGRCEVYLTRHW